MASSAPALRQRILITGASSGLGAEMARQWARSGRALALCARRLDELERLREELLRDQPGLTVSVHPLDVNDSDAVPEVFSAASAALGGLDRVVANAGIARGGPVGRGHARDNRMTALTNFVGTLNQAEAAVTLFRAAGTGHLALISSMSSLRGMGGSMSVYAASKAAVAALAEGLRSELWTTDITVSSVHPGYIHTPMTEGLSNKIFTADLDRGTRSIVAAIERERTRAYVPAWPWAPAAVPMRLMPLGLFRRFSG